MKRFCANVCLPGAFLLLFAVAIFARQALAIGAYSGGPWPDAFDHRPTAMHVSTAVVPRPANCTDSVEMINCETNRFIKWCQTPDGDLYKIEETLMNWNDKRGCISTPA